ncbi:hypothetical protein BCR44DRAFT_1312495 [Catenaria anguillulae PL171]|uniref:Uncharacterized protein n=1 Tax=Catenaria anguillulae PL171 TaxID=765915 RepID=A0A1Y2H778_9FUNG|nr:hypothetical protein BCR44DRAFT_1312495 [Catenaria anguillulae PL171]
MKNKKTNSARLDACRTNPTTTEQTAELECILPPMTTGTQLVTFRVADRVAINTLVFYALGFAVGLATAYKLLPKFVNGLQESRCWPCYHRRRYQGSGKQRRPLTDLLDNPRRLGRHRVALLFSSSLLIIVECISGFQHYFQLWTTGWADTFLLNMTRLFTISLVGLFVMIATIYRISLLIITHPVHRKWVVWGMISLLCVLQLLGPGCVAWVLWEYRHLDVGS